jgi:hypothetical protein
MLIQSYLKVHKFLLQLLYIILVNIGVLIILDNNVRVSAIDRLAMNKGSATIVIVVLCLILVFALSGFAYSSDSGSSSYNNPSYGNSNGGNNNGYNGNNGLNNTPTAAPAVTTNAPVTNAPVTNAPTRVFQPLDTSDATIQSVQTYGDVLVMAQKICNDTIYTYNQIISPGMEFLGEYEDGLLEFQKLKEQFDEKISNMSSEEFNYVLTQQEHAQLVQDLIGIRDYAIDFLSKIQNEQEFMSGVTDFLINNVLFS